MQTSQEQFDRFWLNLLPKCGESILRKNQKQKLKKKNALLHQLFCGRLSSSCDTAIHENWCIYLGKFDERERIVQKIQTPFAHLENSMDMKCGNALLNKESKFKVNTFSRSGDKAIYENRYLWKIKSWAWN